MAAIGTQIEVFRCPFTFHSNEFRHRQSLCAPKFAFTSPSYLVLKRYDHKLRVRCQASSVTPSSPLPSAAEVEHLDLETLLHRIRAQTCWEDSSVDVAVVSGTGRQLGMDVEWQLTVRRDGAFREEVSSEFVSFYSGYDGSEHSTVWDVDSSGVCHKLQLDDHESSLLVAWIRTGVWTLPALCSRLNIEILSTEQERKEIQAVHPVFNDICTAVDSTVFIRLRLKSGHVSALLAINSNTWQPQCMTIVLCGDKETWKFQDWKEWNSIQLPQTTQNQLGTLLLNHSSPSPQRCLHESLNGGQQYITIDSVSAYSANSINSTYNVFFSIPIHESLLPVDATFLPDVPSKVPVWHTRSGHLLAQATINGTSDCGYFIVDTGASGFVVEPAAADALKLESFGEVHVTGMAGKIKGKFRRAETFQIGPLEVKDAVMMEMACSGLVTGAPGPVIGIVGFEIFRRAVVDIPAMVVPKTVEEEENERSVVMSPAAALAFSTLKRRKTNQSENKPPKPKTYIQLHHPEEADHVLSLLRPEDWLPVTLLALLPHVSVTMHPQKKGQEDKENSGNSSEMSSHSALLMIDTGAGGMSAMLNSTAAATLGVLQGGLGKSIRGVGGSASSSVTLKTATVGRVQIGSLEFEDVQCLVASEGAGGGIALSYYSAGILCGGLLSKCRLLIDLPRSRMAILPPQQKEK